MLFVSPRLEAAIAPIEPLRLGVVARYAFATGDDPLGTVRAHAFAGGVSATWRFVSTVGWSAGTGPRVELGGIWARGDGVGGSRASGLSLAGAWEIEGNARVARTMELTAGLELGWLRGVDLYADDRRVLGLTGAFGGASIGARVH
jgi:hypothetical protein